MSKIHTILMWEQQKYCRVISLPGDGDTNPHQLLQSWYCWEQGRRLVAQIPILFCFNTDYVLQPWSILQNVGELSADMLYPYSVLFLSTICSFLHLSFLSSACCWTRSICVSISCVGGLTFRFMRLAVRGLSWFFWMHPYLHINHSCCFPNSS
jgi:hypothetical protein